MELLYYWPSTGIRPHNQWLRGHCLIHQLSFVHTDNISGSTCLRSQIIYHLEQLNALEGKAASLHFINKPNDRIINGQSKAINDKEGYEYAYLQERIFISSRARLGPVIRYLLSTTILMTKDMNIHIFKS